MTKENRELLFIDLCGRLPYGVKIEVIENNDFKDVDVLDCYYLDRVNNKFYSIKPFLFPLSNMKEGDLKSLFTAVYNDVNTKIEVSPVVGEDYYEINITCDNYIRYFYSFDLLEVIGYIGYEWLNAHHYDYRGLITMDLAIDATGKGIY